MKRNLHLAKRSSGKAVPFVSRRLAAALAGVLVASADAATIVVDRAEDGSVGGHCTLRDAIAAANTDIAVAACAAGQGADTIEFADGVTDIVLRGDAGGELLVTSELTLQGANEQVNVRREATDKPFRILYVRERFPLRLHRIAVSGGATVDESGVGGGIRAPVGRVILADSKVSGNSTNGRFGIGGGIYAYAVELTNSVVSDNSTRGEGATAGGIRAFHSVSMDRSSVSGNSTLGYSANAGGIVASQVELTDSIVSNNSTVGRFASGGGITAFAANLTRSIVSGNSAGQNGGGIHAESVTLLYSSVADNSSDYGGGGISAGGSLQSIGSTISGNSTAGETGGGVIAFHALFANSTVSGNSCTASGADGGGIFATELFLDNSTVTGNSVTGAGAAGAGVMIFRGLAPTLRSSLVSDNLGDGADIDAGEALIAKGSNNLVGSVGANVALPSDTLDCGPELLPLADNGGPTRTHALAGSSCAIDAGIQVHPLAFDQRGTPFLRVAGAKADIGAVELQETEDRLFRDGFDVGDHSSGSHLRAFAEGAGQIEWP